MNLFRPYQVAAEIWRASDPQSSGDWWQANVGNILRVWWGGWLIMFSITRGAARAYTRADTIQQMITANMLISVGEIVTIIAAVITIKFVWDLTQRQNRKHAALVAAVTSAS